MLSRALSLATVMLLIGFTAVPAQAQNLEAGKTPSQIFAGGCAVCHKSPRGLLKSVAPGALPGFLRQHYTTSTDMASLLSAYVISNGATDTRFGGGGLTKQGKEMSSEQKPAATSPAAAPADEPGLFGFGRRKREPEPQEAKPDVKPDQAAPTPRQSRNAKRQRPAIENPDAAKPAVEETPATENEAVAKPEPRQKSGKKNRRDRDEAPKAATVKDEPKMEAPKADAPKIEATKPEPAKPVPLQAPKEEASKPVAKPADEARPEVSRPEPAKSESRVETPLRADPVPAVTPAPRAEPDARPSPSETPSSAPTPGAPAYVSPAPAAEPAVPPAAAGTPGAAVPQ
ncbi:MAG: hypothetical protein H7312_00850 [Tardiphaga sp.]|nr:hypothetical protein [Tardiphaga sp.]